MTQISSAPASRSDRRRTRTRGAIIAAGQTLFATRSLEGVSIDDIVAAADVAKGSFYNHFDDKEGLADAIVELVQGDVEYHVFTANQDIEDPAARVVRALGVVVKYALAHPDRVQALVSLAKRRTDIAAPLNAGASHDVRRGLETGRFRGVSLQSGVLIILGLIGVVIDHIAASTSADDARSVVAEVGVAILRALGVASDDADETARAVTDTLPLPEFRP